MHTLLCYYLSHLHFLHGKYLSILFVFYFPYLAEAALAYYMAELIHAPMGTAPLYETILSIGRGTLQLTLLGRGLLYIKMIKRTLGIKVLSIRVMNLISYFTLINDVV